MSHNTYRIVLALGVLLFSTILSGQLIIDDSTDMVTVINQKLEKQSKNYKVAGAVLTVVHRGKVIYNRGVGHENIERDILTDPEQSQFRVASITKTFTALGIMQLVDKGILNLHEDIRTYLPEDEYPMNTPYVITIHDLLTHTAGFEFSNVRVNEEAIDEGSLEAFVKSSLNNQVFRPGEVFYYSNKGYGILGHLIEKFSNMSYEDYIEQHILRPMNMTHSTLYQHTADNPIARPVSPYRWVGDSAFVERERHYVYNPAATTLNTTGLDMAHFMLALMDTTRLNGQALVNPKSYDMMSSIQFSPPVLSEAMGYGMMIDNYRGYKSLNH